jgi:hypothetical protein
MDPGNGRGGLVRLRAFPTLDSLTGCRLFETLHTVFVWMYLYSLTVSGFGNPLALNDLPRYFDWSITMQALVGSCVQVRSFRAVRRHERVLTRF